MKPENSQKHPSTKPASDDTASVLILLVAMADTTWRMFTPPAILVAAGLWADRHLATAPWLTLLGAVVGLSGSVLLVRRQLKKV